MEFLLSLLLLACPQDEDLNRRVHRLVEQLQSDEIQAVDEAVTGLIALGLPALPPIREELKKASGDAKLRLEEALRAIDRNGRRGKAMGPPVLATLEAKDRALADALEEFRKSTGQPLVWKDLPAGTVTVSLDKAPFWEALDRLCRAHGGIMWSVKEKEILVTSRAYREQPRVFRGNQVIFFERLHSDRQRNGPQLYSSTTLEGGVAWVRGSFPPVSQLNLEIFKDDLGTDLMTRPGPGFATFTTSEDPVDPEVLVKPLYFNQSTLLHNDAKTLARLKGEVRLEYTLDSKRLALFEKPQASVGKVLRSGPLTITLKRCTIEEESADLRVHINCSSLRDKPSIRVAGFRLLDAGGKAYVGSGWVDEDADEDTGKVEFDASLDFTLPEGKIDITSLEISVPTDLETIVVPFDFKDLPLR